MDYILDKIATIVPIHHLSAIKGHERFMALVHLLNNQEYLEFYEAQVDIGKWVILDNSTVELGEPFPMEEYLASAMRLNASEILLPDWLYDRKQTLEAAEIGLKLVKASGYGGQIMGVPQGATQEEWVDCLRQMLRMGITSIGLSRRYLTNKFGMSRLLACYTVLTVALQEDYEDTTVHLLGAGLPAEMEVAPCLRLPWVSGVDSAMPSYFSKAGIQIPNNAHRPPHQRDLLNDEYSISLLAANVEIWRGLCANEAPL